MSYDLFGIDGKSIDCHAEDSLTDDWPKLDILSLRALLTYKLVLLPFSRFGLFPISRKTLMS